MAMRGGAKVGVDFGTAAITAVVMARKKDGAFGVIGVGSSPSAGMRRGAIVDVEEASTALKKALSEASRQSGMEIRSGYVGIGGTRLQATAAKSAIAVSRADGEVTAEDVERVVAAAGNFVGKNPNREIIHLMPRQFKVDGEASLTEPIGMVGMKLEADVLVIDAAKPALQNLIKCCELVGFEIENWMSSTIAASEVALTKKQKDLGVMLLDLGADTSDYAIYEEGRLIDLGSFAIGGNHITSDIAIGFRTPVSAAEEIKLRYANATYLDRPGARREMISLADFVEGDTSAYHVRDLAEIVSARLTDMFELAAKALKKSGRAGLLPGGVVLTGGVSDIPGIAELARRELRLPVDVTRALTPKEMDDVIPPRLAIPVGLVLWHELRGEAKPRFSLGALEPAVDRLKALFRAFIP